MFPTGWLYKAAVNVQSSQVSGTQTNFPVHLNDANIRVNNGAMLTIGNIAAALADGADIRFSSDVDGTVPLACQVQQFVQDALPANALASIFVKFPSITNGTVIYMWWGKSDAMMPSSSDTYGSIAVWQKHSLVLHHDEITAVIQSATQPSITDSKTATLKVTSGVQPADGPPDPAGSGYTSQAGKASTSIHSPNGGNFVGCTEVGGSGSAFTKNTGDSISFSAFIYPTQMDYYGTLISKGCTAFPFVGVYFNYCFRHNGDGSLSFFFRWSDDSQYSQWDSTSSGLVSANNWNHVAFSFTFGTGSSLVVTVDGVTVPGSWNSGNGNETPYTSTQPLWFYAFGIGTGNILCYHGRMDEIRLSDTAFSVAWFLTEFKNLNSPTAFAVIDAATTIIPPDAESHQPGGSSQSGGSSSSSASSGVASASGGISFSGESSGPHSGQWVSVFEDDSSTGTVFSNPQPLCTEQDNLAMGKEVQVREQSVGNTRSPNDKVVVLKGAKPQGGIAFQFRSSDLLKVAYSHFQLGSAGTVGSYHRYSFYPKKEPLNWGTVGAHPLGTYGSSNGQPYTVSLMKKAIDQNSAYGGTNALFFKHGVCDKLSFKMGSDDLAMAQAGFKFRDLDYGTSVPANPQSAAIGSYATTPGFVGCNASVAIGGVAFDVAAFEINSDQGAQEFSRVGRQAPENYNFDKYKLTGNFSFDLPMDGMKEIGSMFGTQPFAFLATLFNSANDQVVFDMPVCVRLPFDVSGDGDTPRASIPFEAFESGGVYPIRVTVDTGYSFSAMLP